MREQHTTNKLGFFISERGYIPWRHFWIIRDRFAKGHTHLSLLFPLSRQDLAKILTAEVK